MFVVRRAFRNYNQMITPGSIVEPGDIKWFKTRLRDRCIVEVTEQDLDKWEDYFVGKFGVSIKENMNAEPVIQEEPVTEEPVTEEPVTEAAQAVKPKVVVAAVNK